MRVVRVELDNGRRLVGLRYPEALITEVSLLIQQQKLNSLAVCISYYDQLKILRILVLIRNKESI